MRPLLPFLLVAGLCAGTASAADYSKTIWSYATGKSGIKPIMDGRFMGQVVLQMWTEPRGVPAEGLMFMYMPKLSQAHWAILVINHTRPAGDYLGASRLDPLRVATDPRTPGQKMTMYRVGDGTFKGLYLMAGTVVDKRGEPTDLLMLLTPQMVQQELDPADFLK